MGETVLYASENDPACRDRGWYDHGEYPFVFDTLYPMKGSPAGFGLVAVCKDPQTYIDRLSGNILDNTGLATNPRYFVQDNNALHPEDLLDASKRLIPVAGSLDELHLRKLDVDPVDGNSIAVLQMKIDEMKETSGNRDVSSRLGQRRRHRRLRHRRPPGGRQQGKPRHDFGGLPGLPPPGGLVLELMRQFYTEERYFRVTAPDGGAQYLAFSAGRLGARVAGVDRTTGEPLFRRPVFDIRSAPKSAPPSPRRWKTSGPPSSTRWASSTPTGPRRPSSPWT